MNSFQPKGADAPPDGDPAVRNNGIERPLADLARPHAAIRAGAVSPTDGTRPGKIVMSS